MAESIVKKLLTKLAASLPKDKLAKFKLGDLFKKKKKKVAPVEDEEDEEANETQSEGTEVIADTSDKTGEIDVTELREGVDDSVNESSSEEVLEAEAESDKEVAEDDKTISEDKSLLNKFKTKFLGKFKKSKQGSDGDNNTTTNSKIKTKFSLPKDTKKLDRSKIIKIVVTLAIVYFVVDEFVLNEQGDSSETETVVAAKPVRKRPVKKVTAEPTPTPIPADVAIEADQKPTEIENSATEVKVDEPAVSETVPVEAETVAEVATPVDQNPSLETPVEPVETVSEEIPTPVTVESVVTETAEDQNDKIQSKMDKTEVAEVEKVKFERAPNYEILGRGLVYNCEGKHWACVDKEGFSRCEMNKKWHESKGSKPSCVPFETYESEVDCGKAQQLKINEVIKTDFCK